MRDFKMHTMGVGAFGVENRDELLALSDDDYLDDVHFFASEVVYHREDGTTDAFFRIQKGEALVFINNDHHRSGLAFLQVAQVALENCGARLTKREVTPHTKAEPLRSLADRVPQPKATSKLPPWLSEFTGKVLEQSASKLAVEAVIASVVLLGAAALGLFHWLRG